MGLSESYASGKTPGITDPQRKLLIKAIRAIQDVVVGDISGVTGVYSGSGAPGIEVVPTGSAAIYYDTANNAIYLWNGAAWV